MDDPLAEPGLAELEPPVPISRMRIISMMVGVSLLALGLLFQLVRVQFGPYAPIFADWALNTAGRLERLVPARGNIYDRHGNLLATNASRYFAEIELRQLSLQSRHDIATAFAELLGLPYDDLRAQLDEDWLSVGQYRMRLTRQDDEGKRLPISVEKEQYEILVAWLKDPLGPDLSGLDLVPAPRRVYPAGTLAGHVMGFVNQEGRGFFGVEGYYDEWLSGRPITVERPIIPPEARVAPDPPAGVNLVLTLDSAIQQAAESLLKEAIEDSESESGQIIVMDPRNGEILAMAAWPELNPNDYDEWLPGGEAQPEDEDDKKDSGDEEGKDKPKEEPVITPGVAGQFEPGSTFKVLTMAAALDAGVVTPYEQFVDTGQIEVGGHTIRNWDYGSWGPVDMIGCLQHSLNVCLAHVAADELGASLFYSYMSNFGIGQITGADLAGEIPGKMRTPHDPQWTESDLGTNSFGQGVSLSPIQLMAAVSAIANDGFMVQPHIIKQVVGPQGVYAPKTTVLSQPISTDTARLLTEMLAISLEGETAYARLPGFRIAGKTGTAQIAGEYGYDPRWTIASFIGWGPIPNPRFMILVRLDKPESSPWGSVVAAPVFQDLAERVVVLLQIPPDPALQPIAGGTQG
jgi:cell division protein FtsI/penicillin-binding protein 2